MAVRFASMMASGRPFRDNVFPFSAQSFAPLLLFIDAAKNNW
jgi:hypothetical protein